MDLLIVEPLEPEVMQWLDARHSVHYAPELANDPRAFRQELYNARAIIVPPSVTLDAQALHFAPLLRAVGRVSAGAEKIDLDACARAGVEVVRSATATAPAEAEFIIGALLLLLRRFPVLSADGLHVGRELGSCTVGLVGMAPSARAVAQMLAGFGSRVVGYDPSLHASDGLWARWRVEPLGLRELLENSDAVCVQLAYYSRYHGLIGPRFLPYSKPGQVIASIAHSAVFDEAVLAAELRSGRIAAAWFDSLEPGTLDEGRPLAGLENVQVTPRLASTTRESRLRSAWAVVKRVDELLTGAPPTTHAFKPSAPGVPLDLAAGHVLP